jgi:probable O-glycosylation ligase (exosortase A-associated)
VRDLFFVAFLAGLLGLGFKRPFLFVCAYAYVDIVAPQRLSYYLLNSVSLAMVVAVLAIGTWVLVDEKKDLRIAGRQWLLFLLLLYCGFTTVFADVHDEALLKWEWVWKALLFAIFLPFTLRTKLRIEAYLLFMCLSAAAIIIVGGIKTLLSGGGYGALNLMVTNNSGLYEGSTISTVAIAIIPIILWLARFGTIYPPDNRVKLFTAGLIFACLLIPVGTEARTGLICIAVLGLLMLRDAKRRVLYIMMAGAACAVAVPFLPQTFTARMNTISNHQADSSASTRIAVWGWTWTYAQENPLGGGFEAYRQNKVQVRTVNESGGGGGTTVVAENEFADEGRAWHSAYFEMLGEQGFPGLFLFLLIHLSGLVRMEILRRRYRKAEGDKAWIAPLATALQHFQLIYLVGALFVGIAFQPFVLMMLGVQVGFDLLIARREKEGRDPAAAFRSQAALPAGT